MTQHDAKFISQSDVWDFEESGRPYPEKRYHSTSSQDIALHLAGKGFKKAVRCGGGFQVFPTVKMANDWSKGIYY